MLFVNDWNTNDYCRVWVHTMNPVKYMKWDTNPQYNGDPVPKPIEGERIEVYSSGRWCEEGPWQQAIVDIVVELEAEIVVAQELARQQANEVVVENECKKRELLEKAAATFAVT
jgi:hypothetical protein